VIIRKRKTGLSLEKEFIVECHLMAWHNDFKRQRLSMLSEDQRGEKKDDIEVTVMQVDE